MKNLAKKTSSWAFLSIIILLTLNLMGCKQGSDGFFQKESNYIGGSGGGLKDDGSNDSADKGDDDSDHDDQADDDSDSDSDRDGDKSGDQDDDKDEDHDGQGCSKDKDKNRDHCPEKISREKISDGSIKWQDIACDQHKVAVCKKNEGKSHHHGAFKLLLVDHHAVSGLLNEHKDNFLVDCKDITLIHALTNNFKRHEDCNCQKK